MQKHYNYLTIDLDKDVYQKIKAIQGDAKSRFIQVDMISNNIPYDLTNTTVKIYGEKSDSKSFFNNANIVDAKNGKIEIELTNQALAVVGLLKCQIVVLGTLNERLTSTTFYIDVKESIVNENAIQSTNEFNAFTKGLSNLAQYDIYKQNVDDLKQQVKNLVVTSGDSNAEIVASRGAFGYLPDRLSNIDNQLKTHNGEFDAVNNKLAIHDEQFNTINQEIYRILKAFGIMKRDKFGFYSFDFIGDSITEGYDSTNHYSKSYFAYVRNSILKAHNSSNIGYVNMSNTGFYASTEYVGSWERKQDYYALGNQSSATSQVGATMKMWVHNPQKFFKICYSSGSGYGSFDVYNEDSGALIGTVDCSGSESHNNISQEFTFSEISASRLVKIVCKSGKIKIHGVWFYDNIDDVMVNNYSRSGMSLTDTSVQLINDMTTGNITFLALNHNDSASDTFKLKLDRMCDSVKSNNGFVFMLDFRWGQTIYNDNTKKMFHDKFLAIREDGRLGSYYCDMGKTFNNDIDTMWELGFFLDDTSHPSDVGMMFIAKSICKVLHLDFTLDKPINDKWNIIGTFGNPSFKNGHRNYSGYQSKFRLKDGIVSVLLTLDSAYQGSSKFIFYMPSYCRPSVDTRVTIQHMDGDRLTMHVGMDGKVYMISDVEQNHRFINFSYPI